MTVGEVIEYHLEMKILIMICWLITLLYLMVKQGFFLGSMDTNEFDCVVSFKSTQSRRLIVDDLKKAISDGDWKYAVWDEYSTYVDLRVKRIPDLLRNAEMLSSNYEKLNNFLCEKGFKQSIDYQRGRIYTETEE